MTRPFTLAKLQAALPAVARDDDGNLLQATARHQRPITSSPRTPFDASQSRAFAGREL